MTTIECAEIVAKRLHAGQTDLAGFDFFEGHLTHVANMCYEKEAKIIAYLHDAARYTNYSEHEIVEMFIKTITEQSTDSLSEKECMIIERSLNKLNPKNYSSRQDYIFAMKGDARLCFIKKADINYNIQLLKMTEKNNSDESRLERYYKEYEMLSLWYNDPDASVF